MKLYILLYIVMSVGLFYLGHNVMSEPFIYSLGGFQVTHDGLGFVLYLAGLSLSYAGICLLFLGGRNEYTN